MWLSVFSKTASAQKDKPHKLGRSVGVHASCISGWRTNEGCPWLQLRAVQRGYAVWPDTIRQLIKLFDPDGVEPRQAPRRRLYSHFNTFHLFSQHFDSLSWTFWLFSFRVQHEKTNPGALRLGPSPLPWTSDFVYLTKYMQDEENACFLCEKRLRLARVFLSEGNLWCHFWSKQPNSSLIAIRSWVQKNHDWKVRKKWDFFSK